MHCTAGGDPGRGAARPQKDPEGASARAPLPAAQGQGQGVGTRPMPPTAAVMPGATGHYYHSKPEPASPDVAARGGGQAAPLEDEWVGCDGCSKWRKVQAHWPYFDRNKSFYCNMIEALTCDTPEEKWDDDDQLGSELVDDRSGEQHDSSRSTTPRGGSGDSQRRSASKRSSGTPANSTPHGTERASGKRKCFRPSSYSADGDVSSEDRWRRSRRAPSGEDSRHLSRDEGSGQRANRGGGQGPGGGVQGMSRLDAVVRVLKATGKALHYNIITRQALQQGIIRFTGSQGTAGESMKAFLNKTIRENKTAAIVNMGKGVYGKLCSGLQWHCYHVQRIRSCRGEAVWIFRDCTRVDILSSHIFSCFAPVLPRTLSNKSGAQD